MKKAASVFLGNTSVSKAINGGIIALTGYSDNKAFEEWHTHENASISFLLNGNHQEELLGKHHQRHPGDIKFIPAGEWHRCNNYTTGTQKINLDLNPCLLQAMEVSENSIMQLLQNTLQAKFTLLKLYHELNDVSIHSPAAIQSLLYELLKPCSGRLSNIAGDKPRWANQLKEILNDEWNSSFDLHDLAIKIGVHPVTISRYFPQYFSSTLSAYLTSIKIDKSFNLIKSTSLSLTEIAYTCGFADQAHFTRIFKAYTGFLPKHFRKI